MPHDRMNEINSILSVDSRVSRLHLQKNHINELATQHVDINVGRLLNLLIRVKRPTTIPFEADATADVYFLQQTHKQPPLNASRRIVR